MAAQREKNGDFQLQVESAVMTAFWAQNCRWHEGKAVPSTFATWWWLKGISASKDQTRMQLRD
jgi:hypothetical protein